MRDIVAADEPFTREEWSQGAGAPALRLARRQSLQARDHRRRSPKTSPSASTAPAPTGSTCAAGRTSPTPRAQSLQAHQHHRRVLARRREAPDAAAHLRHGLADARTSSTTTWSGSKTPSGATTAARPRAGSVHLLGPGRRRACPCGCRRAPRSAASSSAASPTWSCGAATSTSSRRTWPRWRCTSLRPLGALPGRHVPADAARATKRWSCGR